MRLIQLISLLAIALLQTSLSGAPTNTSTPPQLPGAGMFVDQNTLLIAHVDVAAVDPEAVQKWAVALLKAGKSPQNEIDGMMVGLRTLVPPAQKWAGDFSRAGGRSLFLVVSTEVGTPPLVVVPIEGRANVQTLVELLKSPFGVKLPSGFIPIAQAPKVNLNAGANNQPDPTAKGIPFGFHVDRFGDALVLGDANTLKKAREVAGKPGRASRPEFTEGLSLSGPGAIRATAAMTPAVKTLLALFGANLPADLGGEPTNVLSEKLKWATLSIQSPAGSRGDMTVRLILQATDSDAAGRLKKILTAVFRTVVEDGELAKHPDKPKFLAMLEPKVDGDRVEVKLDQQQLTASASVLGPLARAAHEKASRAQSEKNLQLIQQAIRNYTVEFKGQFPRSIQDPALLKYLGTTPADQKAVLTNPLIPEKGPGYVYIRPASTAADPSQTMLAYEAYDRFPTAGVQAVFADGAVRTMKNEGDLKKLTR